MAVVFISRPCLHVMALQDSEPRKCPSLVDLVTRGPIVSHLWEQHQSYFYRVYKYIRASIGQGEMWDEIGYTFWVQDWPLALLAYPLLGGVALQPEPNVKPRAQHVLSWSISQGSLQGSVTLEAAWTANSTPCLSSPGHRVLFSPAPTKSGSSCLQHNSILIACSHRQTLPTGCACPSCPVSSQRVLSCVHHLQYPVS